MYMTELMLVDWNTKRAKNSRNPFSRRIFFSQYCLWKNTLSLDPLQAVWLKGQSVCSQSRGPGFKSKGWLISITNWIGYIELNLCHHCLMSHIPIWPALSHTIIYSVIWIFKKHVSWIFEQELHKNTSFWIKNEQIFTSGM